MANLNPSSPRRSSRLWPGLYFVVIVLFIGVCARFYLPGKGFTYLVMFGETRSARYLPDLQALDHYEIEKSPGYDGQYYAQIAMHPEVADPVLRDAVDGLGYRARRILFCWIAFVLGGGSAAGALHIYAVENIICWLGLAVLLRRWFPPASLGNFVRWLAVLFSMGMCYSLRGALLDGPSLLLLAGAMALLERGRSTWSATLLGIAGLGRETNLLAAAAWPWTDRTISGAAKFGRMLLIVVPLAAWVTYLRVHLGSAGDLGARNFDWPFLGYVHKWSETIAAVRTEGWNPFIVSSALGLVALSAQFLFLALRPRWREPWWRFGAAYAGLFVVLGDAVWEGFPGAAPRVLLPMVLAFNVLLPAGGRWWLCFVIGNISVLMAPATLRAPGPPTYEIQGPLALRVAAVAREVFTVDFDNHWYAPEHDRRAGWHWSKGDAAVTLHNPQSFPLTADLAFGVLTHGSRQVSLHVEGREIWKSAFADRVVEAATVHGLALPPGDTVLQFTTDQPAKVPGNGDARPVAFSLRNLQVTLHLAPPRP